ncbi:MAG: hypothetical protein HY722_14950 [Planctomycetes bacterium]|nr:hypothetical protein [Planctomycetota bacterium]
MLVGSGVVAVSLGIASLCVGPLGLVAVIVSGLSLRRGGPLSAVGLALGLVGLLLVTPVSAGLGWWSMSSRWEGAERASRVACRVRLVALGEALARRTRERGELPWSAQGSAATLQALLDEGYLDSGEAFVCPAGGQRPANGKGRDVRLDEGSCSYLGPDAPMADDTPGTTLLLRDRPGNHPDGGHVLRLDGEVVWEAAPR